MDLLACAGECALHAGEREASGAYAETRALQHAVSSLGAARINPTGVGDSVKLRSARVLLACAGECADVKMPTEGDAPLHGVVCAGEPALSNGSQILFKKMK